MDKRELFDKVSLHRAYIKDGDIEDEIPPFYRLIPIQNFFTNPHFPNNPTLTQDELLEIDRIRKTPLEIRIPKAVEAIVTFDDGSRRTYGPGEISGDRGIVVITPVQDVLIKITSEIPAKDEFIIPPPQNIPLSTRNSPFAEKDPVIHSISKYLPKNTKDARHPYIT